MRVSATFDDLDTMCGAHQAVLDAGVDPENIEIRSAYPTFEEPLPPHRHRPMHIRNWVRFLWVCGAIGGFSMVAYCQLDYPIHTSGHPLIPIPMDGIITYECAQITALIMTCVFFFIETVTFRQRPIEQEEDLDVSNGDIALVVDGPKAESVKSVLEGKGAKIVRTFSTLMLTCLLLALALCQTGCGRPYDQGGRADFNTVKMRNQPAFKDISSVNVPPAFGIYSMPWYNDADLAKLPEPYGRLLTPEQIAYFKKSGPYPKAYTPAGIKHIVNPVPSDPAKETRLYQENCQFCHGADGKGDGPVAGAYAPPPADLADNPALVSATDGDLYWTMTIAPTTMPPFGGKLSARDRFLIVRHIRKLQADAAAANKAGASPSPTP